jgi:catechol 2,3-dioxygenase-like lactoylglutathione lyase family enzyme
VIIAASAAVVAWLFMRLLRWARSRKAGAQVVGAILTEVTQNAAVQEAKRGARLGERGAGDPPDGTQRRQEIAMGEARFEEAHPFQKDVLSLPVTDLDATAEWYREHFGMTEVERLDRPTPTVIMERDGTRIGFAINGGDASQDGAAILVSNIRGVREELESNGAKVANWRVDERDGKKYQVFFVAAPDGLCYYFHEPLG